MKNRKHPPRTSWVGKLAGYPVIREQVVRKPSRAIGRQAASGGTVSEEGERRMRQPVPRWPYWGGALIYGLWGSFRGQAQDVLNGAAKEHAKVQKVFGFDM